MMFHILSVFIIPHFVQTVNAQNRLLGLKKRFSCTKCIFSMRLFPLNELFCTLFCNAPKIFIVIFTKSVIFVFKSWDCWPDPALDVLNYTGFFPFRKSSKPSF